MKAKLLLLVLLCTAAWAPAAEQVYSWTDANGVKHFSDAPPPGKVANLKRLNVRGGVTSEDTATAPAAADAKPAANAQAAAGPVQDSPQARAKICQTARSNLELLESKFQVSDASGKALDTAGRQQQIAQARDQVGFYCR